MQVESRTELAQVMVRRRQFSMQSFPGHPALDAEPRSAAYSVALNISLLQGTETDADISSSNSLLQTAAIAYFANARIVVAG